MKDENNNQNTTVRASHARNSSFRANVIIPNIVVRELIMTGLNLVFPASRIESRRFTPRLRLLLILSIINIALFTTIPMSDIKPIIKGIL